MMLKTALKKCTRGVYNLCITRVAVIGYRKSNGQGVCPESWLLPFTP